MPSRRDRLRACAFLAAVATLAACGAPKPIAAQFSPLSVADARRDGARGTVVRWGGTLVDTAQDADRTCFQVISHPLDQRARPVATDETGDRFIACAHGTFDPKAYAPGAAVTVVGTVGEVRNGRAGAADYAFPEVDAQSVDLRDADQEREERPFTGMVGH